jgi:hypothetical protein
MPPKTEPSLLAMTEKPLMYLVLGAPGSGRRELLLDLINSGLEKDTRPLILISDQETLFDCEAKAGPNATVGTWTWDGKDLNLEIPPEFTHIFLITDGRSNPVDQVEAFSTWLSEQELELARVISIVNAQLGLEHKELLRWYEACIHFSDIVLLNRREEVPQKWINEFIAYFKKEQHYPCLMEQVKGGKIQNPALILEPEPRRISLIFDELPTLETEDDEEDTEDEATGDTYLDRLPSGRRTKQIPDINKYLET